MHSWISHHHQLLLLIIKGCVLISSLWLLLISLLTKTTCAMLLMFSGGLLRQRLRLHKIFLVTNADTHSKARKHYIKGCAKGSQRNTRLCQSIEIRQKSNSMSSGWLGYHVHWAIIMSTRLITIGLVLRNEYPGATWGLCQCIKCQTGQ